MKKDRTLSILIMVGILGLFMWGIVAFTKPPPKVIMTTTREFASCNYEDPGPVSENRKACYDELRLIEKEEKNVTCTKTPTEIAGVINETCEWDAVVKKQYIKDSP